MSFIVRSVFWISLVLLLLPIGTGEGNEAPTIGLVEAYKAAHATISDLSGFCERNPETCETGGSVMTLVALKAKQAALMAASYVTEEEPSSRPETGIDEEEGSIAGPVGTLPAEGADEPSTDTIVSSTQSREGMGSAGQSNAVPEGTLTQEDLEIPWRLAQAAVESGALESLRESAMAAAGKVSAAATSTSPSAEHEDGAVSVGAAMPADPAFAPLIPLPQPKPMGL